MTFGSPQFFFLIPLLILLGWMTPRLELWKPLRIVLLLLLTVALCDPGMVLKSGGIDLWVLLDRSKSAQDLVESGEYEWRTLLERSKPGESDTLHFIDYATEVSAVNNPETSTYPGGREQTRTALALRDALARMDGSNHNRILLFTDGYSTEPLTGIGSKLIQQGVPLDYRLIKSPEMADFQLSEFNLVERVQIGEPFIVDLVISGNQDGTVPLTISRGGEKRFTRSIEVKNGQGRLRFSDRITQPGSHEYTASITPETDAFTGNNSRNAWIEVAAGPRVILLSQYENDPVSTVLKAQGFEVSVIKDLLSLTPGILTGAKAVILNNVPAYELPNSFLNALTFFVTEQGGGLLMVGGKKSFGSGGYYQSAIDPLLPVSMELKSEHRKLAVAMAIVMDRSGSMAMTTSSGNSKMQLANEGAARAVELMSEMDAVTVFAVDSQAHKIAGLLNVGASRGELLNRIRSIESMGGGIFVYTGMKEAWAELKKAEVGQRHLILFTDAADSEEPGDYKKLIAEMRKENATISVIGLGNRSDPDAPFIEDIANRGEGRMFFTDIPGDLPNIFAQETVTVARSTFIDEPSGTQATGRWYELARQNMEWLGEVGGYNLSYVRDGDEAALISTDGYGAPLVAFGRRGIGRTAAISFPLGGGFSSQTRSWDKMGDFTQTMTRWLMGDDVPSGIGLKHDLDGSELTLDLLYDPEQWGSELSKSPPRIKLQRGFQKATPSELTWERLSPGHYQVTTSLKEGEPVRGAIQVGGAAIPFGPFAVGAIAEWEFAPARISELRETSRASSGSELVDLTNAWKKPLSPESATVRDWFLIAALLLFLLEAFITRTGWRIPLMKRSATTRPPATRATAAVKKRNVEPEAVQTPEPAPTASESIPDGETGESRRSRFQRAKKRL
jgi:uncharacterized membrane protein